MDDQDAPDDVLSLRGEVPPEGLHFLKQSNAPLNPESFSFDALAHPILLVRFTFADGTELNRDFTIGDIGSLPSALTDGPPDWLEDPLREWSRPLEPITLTGRVIAGREDEARAALA